MNNVYLNKIIEEAVHESIRAKQEFFQYHSFLIENCARIMAERFSQGKKVLLFGNGGSAADCQHIAAEFVNRFQIERHPLAAIALTCDTSVITSISNDYSYEDIFLKQIQALGQPEDLVIAITTSGNSSNVIKAVEEAKKKGLFIIGFSGVRGRLKELSDISFCVNSYITARIQEVHILLAHILCDLTERILFYDKA